MPWIVKLHTAFHQEISAEETSARVAIYAAAELLAEYGPHLGRPYVDTLNGSTYGNMKELRVTLPDGEWRVAFAFDPDRKAVLLVSGSKSGKSQKVFYRKLIRAADRRYKEHLAALNSNNK